MNHLPMVFAYLGPETMLPMTSIVAGAVGFVMMFGRNVWSWVSKAARQLDPRGKSGPKVARRVRRIGTGPVGEIDRVGTISERVQA